MFFCISSSAEVVMCWPHNSMLVWGTLVVGVPEVRRAPLQASAMLREAD